MDVHPASGTTGPTAESTTIRQYFQQELCLPSQFFGWTSSGSAQVLCTIPEDTTQPSVATVTLFSDLSCKHETQTILLNTGCFAVNGDGIDGAIRYQCQEGGAQSNDNIQVTLATFNAASHAQPALAALLVTILAALALLRM
jgi:hypothetical protein